MWADILGWVEGGRPRAGGHCWGGGRNAGRRAKPPPVALLGAGVGARPEMGSLRVRIQECIYLPHNPPHFSMEMAALP